MRVAETTGQYEITTELVDGQWRMTFGLESYPSDEVKATGVAAQVLPHELAVTVSSGSGLVRDYPVAELSRMVTDSQFLPEVVLLLTLQERDSLLRAFTRDEEQARIDVQRILTVAVPVAPPVPGPAVLETAGPDSLGTAVILPDLVLANAVQAFPVPIRVVDPVPRPEELVVRPDVVLHQRLEVNPFDHVIGGGIFLPGGIPDVVIDPVPLPDPAPDPLPAPPEQRYTTASTTLVFPVPLRFDVDAHPYLFPSGRPAAGGGWATLVVPWPAEGPASRNHVYFHDEEAGNVFYHLPDAFLIGQRDQAPYGPELSFTVGRTTDPGTGTERAIALISAHLVPQSSPARLYDAAQRLAAHLPAGAGPVDLRQAVHPATCRLELPGSAVTTAAPPDLVHGWWIAETFDFDDLRDVYAVLTTDGAASALLRGRVDVDVMGQVHQVPVEVRLDRLALPPLSWTEKQTFDAQRSMRVELSNVGDVDVSVPSAAGWVDAGEGPVNAAVAGDLPATLSPGATLTLTLTPGRATEGARGAGRHPRPHQRPARRRPREGRAADPRPPGRATAEGRHAAHHRGRPRHQRRPGAGPDPDRAAVRGRVGGGDPRPHHAPARRGRPRPARRPAAGPRAPARSATARRSCTSPAPAPPTPSGAPSTPTSSSCRSARSTP